MKKIFCSVLLVACSMCMSCSPSNETDSFSSNQSTVVEQGKAGREETILVENYNIPVNEEVMEFSFPSEYKNYTYFVAVDDDWYYYADYDDRNQYIKINRADLGDIIELQGLEQGYDFTIEYAYKGKLYINIFYYEGQVCRYELVEISEDQLPKTVLSGEGVGYPEMNFSGKYLTILSVTQKYQNNLDVYDMENQELKHVYDCIGKQNGESTVTGEVINGLKWRGMLPSDAGFCFMVSEMNGQSFENREDGKDHIYYYSFETDKLQELLEVKCLADYVGGTEEVVLVSGGYLGDVSGPKLYVKNGVNYDVYPLALDDPEFIGYIGTGMLEDDRFIAYDGNYYVVVDLQDKSVMQKRFMNQDNSGNMSGSDMENTVNGIYCYEKCFFFSIIEKDVVKLHVVK